MNVTGWNGYGLARVCSCLLMLVSSMTALSAIEPKHPSLIFEEQDLPKLRRAIQSGWTRDAFEVMKSSADKHLKTSVSPYVFSGAKSTGRILNNKISTLALTGILLQDRRYCDHAVELVISVATQKDVAYFESLNGHLSVGDGAHAYAMAYDWLWQYMSEPQRELLREEIRTFGKWLFDDSMTGRGYGQFIPQNLSCNHNSVMHGGLGLCSLVLGEHDEWRDRAAQYVRGYLQHSIDKTGYSYEGVGYYGYGTWAAVPFGVALIRSGKEDIFNGLPSLAEVPEYFLRQTMPWGSELVPINDSNSRIGSAAGLMYLISRFQDRVGLWGWFRLYGKEGDGSFGDYPDGFRGAPVDGASVPYTLIFADRSLQPLAPEKAGLNPVQFFESGRASFRSGWGNLDTLATFTCGYDLHRGHNHRDENSFTFFARGEQFAIDPGYQPNHTRAHNTVLVGGIGQGRGETEYDVNGKTLSFRELSSAWLITGDATGAFLDSANVTRARRRFLFVDAPSPYVVIADELKTKTDKTEFDWLFHTDPSNLIAIDPKNNVALIKGSRRGAICCIHLFNLSEDESLQLTETDLENETFQRAGRSSRYSDYFKEIRGRVHSNSAGFVAVISAADNVRTLPRIRSVKRSGELVLDVRTSPQRVDRIRVTSNSIRIDDKP